MLALEGNQSKLHDSVADHLETHMENDFAYVEARCYTEQLKGHGRVDEISYCQLPTPKDLLKREKWKGHNTIGLAIRIGESNGKTTSEVQHLFSVGTTVYLTNNVAWNVGYSLAPESEVTGPMQPPFGALLGSSVTSRGVAHLFGVGATVQYLIRPRFMQRYCCSSCSFINP